MSSAIKFSEQDVANAYVYLLSRFLVLRQEHVDLREEGVDYNIIKYNPVGSADFVNPNLDVAYLEAWIAVDANTPAILTIPEIKGRYYTAQLLDGWGEVIVNINERNFPDHPYGRFAFIAPGSNPALPDDAVPIELHSHKAKMLARVELGDDWDGAVALQKQFTLEVAGNPTIEPALPIPMFDNKTLLDASIFELAGAAMDSAPDVSPVAADLGKLARRIGDLVSRDKDARTKIETIIREKAVSQFLTYAVTKAGSYQNNWLATLIVGHYGDQYWTRSSANLVGIWANTSDEVLYFIATRDSNGELLNGSNRYRIHFPADQRPDAVVNSYWSVILVSLPDYRVVPNPDNRFNLNSYSPLVINDDGSLDIFLSPQRSDDMPAENWLPTPEGAGFSLTLRTYVPKAGVREGKWFPAPVTLIA